MTDANSDTSTSRPAWAARTALLAVVVASPWPFGSVTPRAAAGLVIAVTGLTAWFLGREIAQKGRAPNPVGGRWLLAGIGFAVFQLTPLPSTLASWLSPASREVYAALPAHLGSGGAGWRPISVEPFETAWTLAMLVALALAYYLASFLFRRSAELTLLVVVTTILGAALASYGVYQSARFGTEIYGRFPTESGTPYGPFVNHNHFAGYVECCALVALAAAFGYARRSGAVSLLFGGAAAFMVITLVLSQSRGGLVAFGCGVLVLIALLYDSRLSFKLAVSGGVALVVLFLFLYAPRGTFDRWSRISPSTDTSMSFRAQLWSDSMGLAARAAVAGTGLGTYAAIIPAYRTGTDETRAEHAESDWVELLCETGAVGLGIVAAFLVAAGRGGLVEAREDRSARGRSLRFGLAAACVALLVHGLFDFNFRIPSNALLFAVLLGAFVPASSRELIPGRLAARRALAVLLAVAALGLGATVWAMGESRRAARAIDPLLTSSDEFSRVLQTLARSRARMPFAPSVYFLTGRLYNEEAYRSPDEATYREARLGQAVDQFRIALEGAPARGRYWFELAWTEANRGNRGQADRLFARALWLEPHWSDLRANHALYLAATGRTHEAIAALEEGRALDPGLGALDALNIIGPYVKDDETVLHRVAGNGEAAEQAIAAYRRARGPTKP